MRFLRARFGQVIVLQIVDVFGDGLTRKRRLGPASLGGEPVEPFFNSFRQSDGEHVLLLEG